MIKELKEIREELLTGVENSDLLYIKMQINKIDTLIYNLVKNEEPVKREKECVQCGSKKFETINITKEICLDCGRTPHC